LPVQCVYDIYISGTYDIPDFDPMYDI
jgi:hypothetical protein